MAFLSRSQRPYGVAGFALGRLGPATLSETMGRLSLQSAFPGVIEDILLRHAGQRAKVSRIDAIKGRGLFHPGVHRKGLHFAQSIEQRTIRHLAAHAGQRRQRLAGLVGFHSL